MQILIRFQWTISK